MLLSSLNTGSTDVRDTEVQQPNTTATLSFCSSSRAFSANSGQFEAGSTTTASSFLPSKPPFLFWASIIISTVSFSVVSLMAIVPERECSTPTLIVSCAAETLKYAAEATSSAAASHTCLRFIVCNSLKKGDDLHLNLKSDARLIEVRLHGRERRVAEEEHQARVELLHDVVEVELGGLLVVVGIGNRQALAEVGLGELAEYLEGARRIGRLGEHVAAEDVAALAVAVLGVVAAQLVVAGELGLDRIARAIRQFLLEQEVRGRCGVAVLRLHRAAEGQQVLAAVVGAVEVVAVFLVPEVDLRARGDEHLVVAGR